MADDVRVLYCNCTYAQVVPRSTKGGVLRHLCESGASFDAVADLCEMSARKDPALHRLADEGPVKIAACFPRAVKWLFAAGNAPLDCERTEVINMRTESAEDAAAALTRAEIRPNLPEDNRPAVAVASVSGESHESG
ncbi:MAG: hypothetical protein M2R45_03309 [Verrucomicrobia subdivision 3 bacterium]|nr:hypothetical protein [Limisphaerales bacterium]MCS1415413.1 hypothetical protein [Limisphaerales bacterium]